MTKKKWIIVALAIIIIVAGAMGGYIWYQMIKDRNIRFYSINVYRSDSGGIWK